jgi:hypothetical protein
VTPDLARRDAQDDSVQCQVGDHDHDCQPDGFTKSPEKNGAEQQQQNRRDQPLTMQPCGRQRILDHVLRRVSGRQRDRDDEARCRKTQERQHQRLALPLGK